MSQYVPMISMPKHVNTFVPSHVEVSCMARLTLSNEECATSMWQGASCELLWIERHSMRVYCTNIYTHIETMIYIYIYMPMYVCMDGCMYAWIYGCMGGWMHGCMDVWMEVCKYVTMYVLLSYMTILLHTITIITMINYDYDHDYNDVYLIS